MNSLLVVLVLIGVAVAEPLSVFGVSRLYDDGQWKPHLDGSWMGMGRMSWMGYDDGQWKPAFDNSAAGLVHHLYKRDLIMNPYSMHLPMEAPHVAITKMAHLEQQKTEAMRNMIGGIPLHLPADTPEVAMGKQAHAIAHEKQKALTTGLPISSIHHSPVYSSLHHPMVYSGVHGIHGLW